MEKEGSRNGPGGAGPGPGGIGRPARPGAGRRGGGARRRRGAGRRSARSASVGAAGAGGGGGAAAPRGVSPWPRAIGDAIARCEIGPAQWQTVGFVTSFRGPTSWASLSLRFPISLRQWANHLSLFHSGSDPNPYLVLKEINNKINFSDIE